MQQERADLLREVATVYSRAARVLDPVRLHAWEELGLTLPQLRILFLVRGHPAIDVRGLAQALGISPSAVSQQVDKLVARGFLDRSEAPTDRRHVRLALTDLGEQATGEISRASRAHVETVLSSLGDDELHDLQRLLGRLVEAIAATPLPVAVTP